MHMIVEHSDGVGGLVFKKLDVTVLTTIGLQFVVNVVESTMCLQVQPRVFACRRYDSLEFE